MVGVRAEVGLPSGRPAAEREGVTMSTSLPPETPNTCERKMIIATSELT